MSLGISARDWSSAQWGRSDFGDKRRTERAVKMGAELVSRSGSSLPKQMVDSANLKGAYRLLKMPEVTHSTVSWEHWEATRERMRSPGLGVVLFVQDGTELDFGARRHVSGLGFAGNTFSRGLQVHSTLCVLPGDPLWDLRPEVAGLALQTVWARDHAPRKKIERGSERLNRRTEYDVWEETVQAIGPAPAASCGTRWVSVGDRASDVFGYMGTAIGSGWDCVVRSRHDRRLEGCGVEEARLYERVRGLGPMAGTRISLRGRAGVRARDVELHLAWTPVALHRTKRSRSPGPLSMNCVRVWEDPEGSPVAESLEWVLLTSLEVAGPEDALRVCGFYKHRWLIEEYHKCLKTGCVVEDRQLSTKDRLLALLGFLSIVAVALLQLKAPARGNRSPADLVDIVRAVTGAKEDLDDPPQLLRRIAMLGGFLGRKGDGNPGWQTTWAGWNRLRDIIWGMELAQSLKRSG